MLPTTMNTLPAKMVEGLSLIRTFATFPSSQLGAPNYGFVSFLHHNRGSRLNFPKTVWSLEKCSMRVENSLQALRPASEAFAQEATEALKAGKVIAVPTDTLYGLACDACSSEAVNRIYEIKGRKLTSPLAICVGDVSDITRFAVADHLPHGLLDSLLPGPVTVVLKRGESSILEKSLNPGLESIGVRVPDADFIRLISRRSGTALALTSANLSGQPSSVCVNDFENLWQHCAYVYDGGVLPAGRAGSTIIDLTKRGTFKIIRAGSAKEQTVATLKRYSLLEDADSAA
ncbi:yrdC domain-containing protein, mitochondrial-like [Cucurbita pepo subsp. pepo]|uniref:yrdC domain-containing protein, mitochondrial-like n=1 Tax=Cucurbita pepo subsp. pepo TaxID=3664 RepID=UPI000C9D5834|nr:yrdC domain-containing protein, mitochondrial-like [Cucurbita pepo subsp. pepo]XP_023523156.1 yrdC domain-containing protein, mitochondrial-like [Cucurbita pepo subsp. pepo]